MLLCATSLSTGKSFIVSPERQGIALPDGQCATYNTFRDSKTLGRLEKTTTFDITHFSFIFSLTSSNRVRDMMSNSLRRTCPRMFDPNQEARRDLCDTSTVK